MTWNDFWNKILNWVTNTGIKLIVAIIILILSFILINFLSKRLLNFFKKKYADKKIDKTLYKTLINICKVVLKILVVIALIGYVGIDTSSVTAVIASTGIGIGLAINGALSNFAGGILLLFTKPFKVDDYIKTIDYEGTVEEILICNTKIRTIDNKVVYIPNGKLSTEVVENYTTKGIRRLDIPFHIHYESNVDTAKNCIDTICSNYEKILKEPMYEIKMVEHSASSIDLMAKIWIKAVGVNESDAIKEDILELVKQEFDKNGIKVPYNQVDVHIKEN